MSKAINRTIAAAAAALALLSLYPLAAQAGVRWVVHGRGFGHGVGMSAYGAYGYARHGKGYRFILAHYYSGTALGTLAAPRQVRVLLGVSGGDVGFSGATSACGQRLDPRRSYEAHRAGAAVKLRSSAGRPLADCGRKLRAAGPGTVTIAGYGTYRGALEAVPAEGGRSLNVVNALAIEQYVRGVMPNEVPPSWPLEELKAQAVAVRSVAISGGVGGHGFDLYSDTRSQVYKGLESESARTDAAVAATRGQVVMYGGEVAQTLYSACSGGHTESAVNVFGSPVPYLIGVPDPYDYYCPLHRWTLKFSGPAISAKLRGYLKGRLRKVVITKRGVSPRIVSAKLFGSGGVSTVTGTDLEAALGGYDTWMKFEKVVGGKRQPSGAGSPPGGEPPTGGISRSAGRAE
ncbi:MAG: SpoIID/LytB domain-containing protein [Nitrososphaerota archaeon]